ncbi:MAG: hypothetical protein VW338_09230 [Rhodospirillaceae bacterium]
MPRGWQRRLQARLAGHFVLSGLVLTLTTAFAAQSQALAQGDGNAAFEAGAGPDGALVIRFKDIDWYPATIADMGGVVARYRFTLDGPKGGILTLFGRHPLKLVNSFPLSPEGGSGHRLVTDLAESPGTPPPAAGSRREAPPAEYGTPPAAPMEPSPRAPSVSIPSAAAPPSVTAVAEPPTIRPAEPLAVDGGNAARPVDTLAAASRAGAKTLVLSHFIPMLDAPGVIEALIGEMRAVYDGDIIIGRDLMRVPMKVRHPSRVD